MHSLLMTAENGQKTYAGSKTQTRRLLSAEACAVLDDLAGADDADGPAPLTMEYVHHVERQDDVGTPYHYTGFVAWLTEYPEEGSIEVPCPFRVGERRYIREPHYLYGRWRRDGQTKTGKPKYRFVADRTKGACYPTNPPPRVCTRKSAVGWFRRPGMFMFEWAARSVVEITALRIQHVQEICAADARAEGCEDDVCAVGAFADLWDSPAIHGPGAWARNDWVVVIEMERVHGAH